MYLESAQTSVTGLRHSFANPAPAPRPKARVGGHVDSEYGRLDQVLLADPRHLALVPCNSVSNENLREGREPCQERAARQHAGLVAALQAEGVDVRLVPADATLPDLAFTRDTSLMTPWGLLGLSPGAAHRRCEVPAVMAAAKATGAPILGRIENGRVEGGDVAMIRPGVLAIGISGERTNAMGAEQLAAIYKRYGWEVIRYHLDPHFLHLDTVFCMVDRDLAIACTDVLDERFMERIEDLGIELLPLGYKEARKLGCNLLSLGQKRVVTSGTCSRIDVELASRGYRSIALDLSEFTMCGGGVHCLTMPLRRTAG
ncbi:MAG: dimethylarginine dimethylaminohydrolase family protein [Allosphingosinicella sp.]|uniref:dimethylarginine dimethylaminohydrolase family protein n=1 Tax=Allosphingosinicella sp. TaxID=2823234 RepID=UPI00394142B7